MTARQEARRDHLTSLPVTEAEEIWEPAGESFHDRWRSLDAAGQHNVLLDLGVRVHIAKAASGILVPDPTLRKGWPDGTRTTRVGSAVIKVDLGKISDLRRRANSNRPGPMQTATTS